MDSHVDLSGMGRRSLFTLGIGVGAATLLGACGGGKGPGRPAPTGAGGREYNGPPVELQFWNGFTGGDGPVMRQLVEKFSTEHDNITVKMNVYRWEDYYTKLPAAVSSGNGPDIAIMHIDSLPTNAARNVIVPLDDVVSALGLTEADFSPVVWKAGEYKGKRYGIPLDVHPLGFFYNKTLMTKAGLDPEKPPQTKADYEAALEALKKAGIQGHWMTPFPFTGSMQFQSLLWQHGGDLFNPDVTETTFNSDAGVTALTWMVDMVRKGYSPKNVGQDADVVALKNGKNAFNWNGIWAINTYKEVKTLEWGAAPLPQIGTERAAWAGSHNFVIIKQRKPDPNRLEASRVFINWISQQSLAWARGGQVPARKSVREDPEFAKIEHVTEIAKQIDELHFAPPVPGISDVFPRLEAAINEAVLLKKEPKTALDEQAAKANKILEQNRKKYGL